MALHSDIPFIIVNCNCSQVVHIDRGMLDQDLLGLKTSDFLDEWRTFISEQSTLSPDLILVGDINIHMDNPSSHYTSQFNH